MYLQIANSISNENSLSNIFLKLLKFSDKNKQTFIIKSHTYIKHNSFIIWQKCINSTLYPPPPKQIALCVTFQVRNHTMPAKVINFQLQLKVVKQFCLKWEIKSVIFYVMSLYCIKYEVPTAVF